MIENGRIAVPSDGNGGINGTRSGHFGHCDVFTLVDVVNSEIQKVSVLENQDHSQGGCMVPVKTLADNQVSALVVSGIGMRPLMGFNQVGIDVYHDDQRLEIEPVVMDLINGNLRPIRADQACDGSGCHDH